MENTATQALMQMASAFQLELFPRLEEELGPLSPQARLLTSAIATLAWDRCLPQYRRGRPAPHRKSLLTAFLAKAIYNFPTTRDLLDRLQCDSQLRNLCGWCEVAKVPSESSFSRAFALFSKQRIAEHLHEALLRRTVTGKLFGHIARDSTAIHARERLPRKKSAKKQAKQPQKPKKDTKSCKAEKKKKGKHSRAKAALRGTAIQRQRKMKLSGMLAQLPKTCTTGVKQSSDGNRQYWKGYKLHLDVADGQIPITALLTSANVHDARGAIPLMTITSKRISYLYDVMDSAYDATAILEHIQEQGRVPVVDIHPRRGTKKPSAVPKVRIPKATPQMDPAKQQRYKERTSVERVNGRLKDEFGGRHVRVRGGAKVMTHLMFGIIAITLDQLMRMASRT